MSFQAVGDLSAWSAGAVAWAAILGYGDIRHRRVPNALTFGAMAVGAASCVLTGVSPLGADATSILSGAVLALLCTLPGYLARQLGAGDVKLLLAVAALGGVQATLIAFVIGALAAGAAAGGWLLWNRQWGLPPPKDRRLPFGAALSLGFIAAVTSGQVGDMPWLR